jgi:Sec-independent protein translocase protein TatA
MIGKTIAVAVAALVGVAASQLPEFGQQYRQRLGGAVDELRRVAAGFDEDAAENGLDRPAALAEMARNPNALVQDRAATMNETMQRLDDLEAQQQAFRDAGPFGRLYTLTTHFDPPLVSATWADYEPAVPATSEGLVSAGGGFLATLLLLLGLGRLVRRRP